VYLKESDTNVLSDFCLNVCVEEPISPKKKSNPDGKAREARIDGVVRKANFSAV
jgi:hypothetical protein